MNTRRTATLMLAGVLVATPFLTSRTGATSRTTRADEAPPSDPASSRDASERVDTTGFASIVTSAELIQGCRFSGRNVDFVSHEYNPLLEVWERFDATYSASFDISEIATRQAHELIVGGHAPRSGDDVVERWIVGVTVGTATLGRPYSTAQIGTPLPGVPGTTIAFVGGQQIPLSARTTPPPQIQRDELYRGDEFNGIRAMAVDPEGRFILVITEDDRLVRFDLSTGLVSTVYTVAEIPSLTSASHLRRRQHLSKGRMYFLESALTDIDDHSITVLIDADNDGVFAGPADSIEFHDMLTYHLAGYAVNGSFSTDFINF